MPDQTDNRLRWERIPILGNNPVFCFEAGRLWTRRTIGVLLLLVLGLGAAAVVLWPVLSSALLAPGQSAALRAVYLFALFILPPRVSALEGLVGLGPAQVPGGWAPYAPYVLMVILDWLAVLAGRYFLPALAAISMASDRASGRLEPLLASRMSVRQIMIGKLMALVLPLSVLMLFSTAVLGPIPIVQGMPNALGILNALLSTAGLFVGSMVGLWIGASSRGPTVGVGLSIVAAGVVLPTVLVAAGMGIAVPVLGAIHTALGADSDLIDWDWVALLSVIVLQVALFASLWLVTKRALTRAAE